METTSSDPGILDETVSAIAADPDSGQSLLLYALIKTLSTEKGGCVFLLTKLRDMTPATRRLAYGLMELMAQGVNRTPDWGAAVARIDQAIQQRR